MGILLLAGLVSAWGPATQEFICQEAVIELWGADSAAECLLNFNLSFQNDFCSNDEFLSRYCVNLSSAISPASMPEVLFNDTENHADYSNCTIKMSPDDKYLCGNESFAPAREMAELFFGKSLNSPDLCGRIHYFCLASNYFSDGYVPTNRIGVKSANGCESAIADGVDYNIANKKEKWYVREVCRFDYVKPRLRVNITSKYMQAFIVTNDGMDRLIKDLVERGEPIVGAPYAETTTTSVVTTSVVTTVPTTSVLAEVEKKRIGGVWLLVIGLIILTVILVYVGLIRRDES